MQNKLWKATRCEMRSSLVRRLLTEKDKSSRGTVGGYTEKEARKTLEVLGSHSGLNFKP